MIQKLKVSLRVILLSMAMFTGWFVFGSTPTVAAANWQAHNQTPLELSAITLHSTEAKAEYTFSSPVCPKKDLTTFTDLDIVDYRWEAMAKFYTAHKDLTAFDAEDILVYRWQAMAEFYMSDQICPV